MQQSYSTIAPFGVEIPSSVIAKGQIITEPFYFQSQNNVTHVIAFLRTFQQFAELSSKYIKPTVHTFSAKVFNYSVEPIFKIDSDTAATIQDRMSFLDFINFAPFVNNNLIEIREDVQMAFSHIPEVSSIFAQFGDNSARFWIFTSENEYDDELMNTLITEELRIAEMFPDNLTEFEYVPLVLCGTPNQIVPRNAQLIFER